MSKKPLKEKKISEDELKNPEATGESGKKAKDDYKFNKIRQAAKKVERKEVKLPEKYLIVDDAPTIQARKRLLDIVKNLYQQIREDGRPIFTIPSRSSKNIHYDENLDLLLLGDQETNKAFHSLTSVLDATRLIHVMDKANELLQKDIHATKREIFYSDVELFAKDQTNCDKIIEDLATILKTIRNSTHIVASAKGMAVGKLRIRDSGEIIDLERMGTGGWSITPFLDKIEILDSDAEFIFVVEKDAAVLRLTEKKFWREYPCIILTAKGAPDIATRMFLRLLTKELKLPVFTLVDSDPYGHYIYSIYLRGSKKLSYESPFLATPGIKLLGVLSQDLDVYGIPKVCKIKMTEADTNRVNDMLKEPFVQQNARWVRDLEYMKESGYKAEIQALSSKGFEYLTDSYLPTKLSTGDWI